MTTTKKSTRTCAVCDAAFRNLTDYSVHVATAHDLGIGRTDRVPLRPVSCWRCASPINVNVTTRCECGFDLAAERARLAKVETQS